MLAHLFLTSDPHNPNLIWLGTSGNGIFRGEIRPTGLNAPNHSQSIPFSRKGATIIRNTLFITPHQYSTQKVELLDIAGRKVAELSLGINDVHQLRTGVYFIPARSVSKVVITR